MRPLDQILTENGQRRYNTFDNRAKTTDRPDKEDEFETRSDTDTCTTDEHDEIASLGDMDTVLWSPPGPHRPDLHVQYPAKKLMGRKKSIITLCKSLIGTTVLFVAHGYKDAGVLLGICISMGTGLVAIYAILLLLEVKALLVKQRRCYITAEYADIAAAVLGSRSRSTVLLCLSAANFGFCAVYIVFIAENTAQALPWIWPRLANIQPRTLIVIQTILLIPLMWLRRLKYYAFTNSLGILATVIVIASESSPPLGILATVIVIGYLYFFEVGYLVRHGPHPTLVSADWSKCLLFLGTSMSAFEGFIPLCLPIQNSMKKPQQYSAMIKYSMTFIVTLLSSFGLLGYLCFGENTRDMVIMNLPGHHTKAYMQLGYALCIFFTYPPILYVTIKIVEKSIFGDKRRTSVRCCGFPCGCRTWMKNIVRMCVVIVNSLVAYIASKQLANLVSLVGILTCTPLGLIFPPLFHVLVMPRRGWEPYVNMFLVILGVVLMIASLVVLYLSATGTLEP
eukprot:g81598.t1